MKSQLNTLYKNQSLIYKGFLFLAASILIVYLFPKGGKFKYEFQKGKPWQYENLYAPFDFPIYKSEAELKEERTAIERNQIKYFSFDSEIAEEVAADFETSFGEYFKDTLSRRQLRILREMGKGFLDQIYETGVLSSQDEYDNDELVNLIKGNEVRTYTFGSFFRLNQLQTFIRRNLSDRDERLYANIYYNLFFDIIKVNVSFDENFTSKALEEELNNIASTRGTIARQKLIIAKNEVVEGEKFDVLNSLKKEYQSQLWNDENYNWIVFGYTILVALALLMLLLFLRKYRRRIFDNNNKVTFIFFNVVIMIFLTTIVVKYNVEYVYVVPLCILPLILKAFFDARLGLFTHVLTVLLLGFIVPNSFEYVFLQTIAGIVTIQTITELYKRANLFISVGQITLIYIIAYFAFYIIHEGNLQNIGWITFGLFILNGLATLFAQPLIYIYEKVFGLVSDVSLLELSNTNSKLLKELSDRAPGTFHHSLQVANLAEASANEIGANAMLVRVGALYHDIGKMADPMYFTENQITSVNPHSELEARESAQIIIRHVIDGIEMARKEKLPDRIIDFIRTHHGTSLVYYFYKMQLDSGEECNIEDFQYPGPIPFSKETAILMMSDAVEAASKSLKNPSYAIIDGFVEKIINKQVEEGQFLNADITFKEIESIKKVLKRKLTNIYHLRIEYPE
ncbi:HDIG domain-containing protein [Leptobacterium flavescens]|uniref:HDIG domain-containing protein n=1 Tax=Leptobacterium flavescens TaxID=472055 RepID=A0A6P0UHE7_9FLAO|nr:HDIG domain-containing metalloprotein [Leptobacterium flavescens]NER11880.1 HDIG domain-containing protein [Leptobacterium flavescens]